MVLLKTGYSYPSAWTTSQGLFQWQGLRPDEVRSLLLAICPSVSLHADRVEVTIDSLALLNRLEPPIDGDDAPTAKTPLDADVSPLVLTIPARLRRAGMEMRMVVDDGSEPARVDTGLVRALVRGFAIRDQLFNDHSLSPSDIANREGVVPSYATRLFRLTFLAPDIIATILEGRHPPELSVRKLLDDTRLPLDWTEQRTRLGFG
jgi:site-specific DNA recombinase